MNDEPVHEQMEYEEASSGSGNIKKGLMWIVPLVIVIVVLFIIINQKAGKNDSEYADLISKANTSFNLEEYRKAKINYEAALSIKPEADLPLVRISAIDSILTFREEARIKESAEVKTTEISQDSKSDKTESREKISLSEKSGEQKAKTASTGSGSYHIVIGCFEIRNNAINYSKKLREKGFSSIIIPILDGRMSAVTYQSFETEEEAFKTLRHVQKDFVKEAWVLKH